jgi:predicted amidophosphoribosyltransferase
MEYLRMWMEADINEVKEHIVVVDDKFGFCPGCKQIGIKLENLEKCPQCGREFKYVTAREARGGRGHEMVVRVRRKLPKMTFLDYEDYDRLTGKKKAEDLFKGI